MMRLDYFSVVLILLCSILRSIEGKTSLDDVKLIYSRYKKIFKGEVTYFGTYPVGKGACTPDPLTSLGKQRGWIQVAADFSNYKRSVGCGMCVEIYGKGIGSGLDPVKGTYRAVVTDLCAEGCYDGGFDYFVLGDGRWQVTYKAVECPSVSGQAGNIMFRFQGSNPWYLKVQVRNSKIPTAGLEVLQNGRYRCLNKVNDNYFESLGVGLAKVEFPLTVRVTSVSGQQLVSTIPEMKNDVSFPTNIQYSGIDVGCGPSKILCFGQGMNAPYPPGGLPAGTPPTLPPTQPPTMVPQTTSPPCVPITCGPGCKYGTDSNGCGICICTTLPPRPPTRPPTPTPTPTPSCPWPVMTCPCPTGTDSNGCPTCDCQGTVSCVGKPESSLIADPTDCHSFYLCSHGFPVKRSCGDLAFDPTINACNWPQAVGC